jgi:hypothetical protein
MAKLARALEDMPGSETIKVHKLEKEKSNIIRGAIVVGIIAALITVYAATSGPRGEIPVHELADTEAPPAGMTPMDAAQIHRLQDWRLATAEDFGPTARPWLRDNGQDLSGHLVGDFSGRNVQRDVAYVLANPEGHRRVVLIVDGINLYDAEYPSIVGMARIPKEAIAGIDWGKYPPQGTPDGDGLLIIRKREDPTAGLVLFVNERRIVSSVPVNYQQIRLR